MWTHRSSAPPGPLPKNERKPEKCYQLSMSYNWEKNQKTFFDFFSSGLGINVSLFRLQQFGKVGSELGSPGAGVEIGTG